MISVLHDALRRHALQTPQRIAVLGQDAALSWSDLLGAVERMAAGLREARIHTLGLYADNGIDWIVADLAALHAGVRCVPLPRFFSTSQLRHALADSGADAVLADDERLHTELGLQVIVPAFCASGLRLFDVAAAAPVQLPDGTAKITYTSGTTGAPKGVCLSVASQLDVAQSLALASVASADDRHLCVLPLSTLLENIGGVYAPLLVGATVIALPQAHVGMAAGGVDPRLLLGALAAHRASSAILVPQLLLALVALCERGQPAPPTLRFIAVGGAPVSVQLLERAAQLGLPVFEGYGLSESASVVALNRPGATRPGSVGMPLAHLKLRIAEDGEVLVRGSGFLGYTGDVARDPQQWLATGDLGRIDEDGRLHLAGRKKSIFITAYGRNIAPEWVECELTRHPAVAHAAVFGEARPWNVAVLVARPLPGIRSEDAIAASVAAANADLPDYARIRHWLLADEPFSPDNGLLTSNGRVRRAEVAGVYGDRIESLYTETSA